MPPCLLIVNCTSPYFFSIPMGSFGLCDHLGLQSIEARIFNPALYPAAEAKERLLATLDALQPSHVGLVCHWQETVHGLLEALAIIRSWNSEVVTLCGGFTAGYFADELLRDVEGLDYVVTGDPEEPVARLLQGEQPDGIPNLVRRENGVIRCSEDRWLIDQPLLDRLAFADCSYLIDAERYLEKTAAKLGFPLLLGRGCVFDCEYCGGSRHAFRLHSGRTKPVTRSLASILADLHRLKNWTRVLYLCYENDQAFVKTLFAAIAADPELCGQFTLHYGAWHLLDPEFLALYRQAFDCATLAPIFEFSPEVCSDEHRAVIKRGRTYSLAALEDNLRAISHALGGRVRLEVFFSRYHPSLSLADLAQEAGTILLFRQRVFAAGLPVHVCFDHLSTDVASRYWVEHQEQPSDFARFLDLKSRLDQGSLYPFAVDNLCLLLPAHLPREDVVRHEALLLVLEQLEQHCQELVRLLTGCLEDRWLGELAAVTVPWLVRLPTADFFADPPLTALVEELGLRLQAGSLPCPPFLADLIRFSRRKLERAQRPAEISGEHPGPGDLFLLDRARMGIHEQDYLDPLPLLERLRQAGAGRLAYQRTVCLFGGHTILTMAHALYRSTLQRFESPVNLETYEAELARQHLHLDLELHRRLLEQLMREGVLRPAG